MQISAIRPDLLLRTSCGRTDVAVEVTVTHPCGSAKLGEFERLRLPALEIDLKGFPKKQFDRAWLDEQILHSTDIKRWLWPLPPRPALFSWASSGFDDAEIDSKLELEVSPEISDAFAPDFLLPPSRTYEFPVRSWSAVVKVNLSQEGERAIRVSVSDVLKGGQFPSTSAQSASPQVIERISQVLGVICPRTAKLVDKGCWIIPAGNAQAVADAIAVAAAEFDQYDAEARRLSQLQLNADLALQSSRRLRRDW